MFLQVVFFTPQNVAPFLRVQNCIFLLKPLCQQFQHTVLLRVVIFGQMYITKLIDEVLQVYSADVSKKLMKNIVKFVIKINWFCCLLLLKSPTQYRVMHVIFKRGDYVAFPPIKLLWCSVHNCSVRNWWYVMLQDGSKYILCLWMFCRRSVWSHTVSEKKEWLHWWLQIVMCAQWCCINAELVIRKLHSFRLQHISCAPVTEESISILVLTVTNQISCDNKLAM